jgi:hypothetical protein
MTSYQIIDNFLEPEYFKFLQTKMVSNNFSWYYVDFLTDELDTEYSFFTHMAYHNYTVNSDLYNDLTTVIQKLEPKAIVRIKANLYINIGTPVQSGMHKDQPYEHKGAILYMNTTNGPTILKDGTRIECVANRLVKFNTFEDHAASYCTDQKYKMVINFNYF